MGERTPDSMPGGMNRVFLSAQTDFHLQFTTAMLMSNKISQSQLVTHVHCYFSNLDHHSTPVPF